jgi:hypothetical protein
MMRQLLNIGFFAVVFKPAPHFSPSTRGAGGHVPAGPPGHLSFCFRACILRGVVNLNQVKDVHETCRARRYF